MQWRAATMTSIDFIYDVPLPNSYSATVQCLKTGRALAERGQPFTFSAGPISGDANAIWAGLGADPSPGVRLRSLFPGWPRSPVVRSPLRRAFLALRGARGDIVMSRGETALDVAPVAAFLGRPFVVEVHRLAFLTALEDRIGGPARPEAAIPGPIRQLRAREAHLMAAADGFVFLTEALREEAARHFALGTKPQVIAPSGVSLPTLVPPGKKTADLVILGKVERRKGVDLALQVLRHLPGRHLLVIGDGPFLEEARALAAALEVAPRVRFAGQLPHGAVGVALAQARIGLCPLPTDVDSVSERFTSPMKLLEMFAAGMPVVASDLPSTRAIATHGRDAMLGPADSPKALAALVAQLLDDPELAARLGQAARARAEDFSWGRRAERIGELARLLDVARPVRPGAATASRV